MEKVTLKNITNSTVQAVVPELAQEYNNLISYNNGDYCTYRGTLYKCIQSCSSTTNSVTVNSTGASAALSSIYFKAIKVTDEINTISYASDTNDLAQITACARVNDLLFDDTNNTIDSNFIIDISNNITQGDYDSLATSGAVYNAINSIKNTYTAQQQVAADFEQSVASSSKTFQKDEIVWYKNQLYKFNETVNLNSWDNTKAAPVTISSLIIEAEDKGMLVRGDLAANTDVLAIMAPGLYRKQSNYAMINPPNATANSHGARLLVFATNATSKYARVHVWIDVNTNDVYVATCVSSTFTAWFRLKTDQDWATHIFGDMEMGQMSESAGWLSSAKDFSYHRSKMMYTCVPGAKLKVKVVEHDTGISAPTAAKILFLAADYSFVSGEAFSSSTQLSSGKTVTVPANAVYFKVQSRVSGSTILRNEQIEIWSTDTVREVFNAPIANTTYTKTQLAFIYRVAQDVYGGGRLILPPNYSVEGKSVPLICYCHGSNAMVTWNDEIGHISGNSGIDYYNYLKYLTDEGFAVFDCYPWGNSNNSFSTGTELYSPLILPIIINSYLEGIKYVCSRFNVDINRVNVLCKSQGGHMGNWAITQTAFPFKSVSLFAPSAGVGTRPFAIFPTKSTKVAALKFGEFEVTDNSTELVTPHVYGDFTVTQSDYEHFIQGDDETAVRAFLNKNKSLLCSMNPSLIGITNGGSLEAGAVDEWWVNSVTTSSTVPQWMIDEGLPSSLPSGASQMYKVSQTEHYVKHGNCPSKFWAATDDGSVPAYSVYAIYHWLRNGASDTQFRWLAQGTGGHHAMDSDPNAEKKSGVTALGIAYTNIPLAYTEVVDFIRSRGGQ